MKPDIKILPFGDHIVAKTFPFGKKGCEPTVLDGRLLKANLWPREMWILLEDGDSRRASTPVSVI